MAQRHSAAQTVVPVHPPNTKLRARHRWWAILTLSAMLHALLLAINVPFPEAREWQPPLPVLQVALVTLESPASPEASKLPPQPDAHAEQSPSASAVSQPSLNPQIERLPPAAAKPKGRSIKRTLRKLTTEPKLPPAKTLAAAPAEPAPMERAEGVQSVPEYRVAGGMERPERDSSSAPLEPDVSATPVYDLVPKPSYPRRSLAVGEQGTVLVAILVGADGKVKEADLAHSSGYPLLDGSALAAVREKWVFKPALLAGKPVESWVRVPVEFRIVSR